MIDQHIPEWLWPEIFRTVILIVNRIATSSVEKMSLYKAFMNQAEPSKDHKPSVAHFRVLGCKTYVLIEPERRVTSRKVAARAELRILFR